LSTERIFQIERFYFGNIIKEGQATGKPTILGRSPGLDASQIQSALKVARVRPPELDMTTEDMPSALGMFRMTATEFVIVKSQRTVEGFPQLMYLVVPDMALRWLAGNYALFESLAYQPSKSFDAIQHDLTPLELADPQTFSSGEQQDMLYDLYAYGGDKVKNIEGLVAGMIHAKQIGILNAPLDLKKRMGFIQGLLCMLPAPARMGITWVTHSEKAGSTPSQINFLSSADNLADYVVYDWEAGDLLTDSVSDKYSKFIASQMRLDASLVVEATTNIARTAVWRAMRKDSLPDALHFASRRAAIDAAVTNNLPADRETVAAILRQDPTLTESMRLSYAEHLLAFTLALGDEFVHADVIPVVAAADRPVAEAIYESLKNVAEGENPLRVVDLVDRWLTHVPQAKVIPWHQLAYIAAHKHLSRLVESGTTDAIIKFLGRIQRTSRTLKMENIVPQLILLAKPKAQEDKRLAIALFLLGAEYLSIQLFEQLLQEQAMVEQFPERLQQALAHLQPAPASEPPAESLLISVVGDFEAQHRMLVIGRLAELAVYRKRENLIDTRIIEGLLRAAQSGYAWRFESLIQYLANKYTQPEMLSQLEKSALEILPHLHFSTGNYEMGVRLLETYQNRLFTVDRLRDFIDVIGNVFLNASLSLESLEQIFAIIEHSQIRPEPRTRAICSVLVGGGWGLVYRNLARRLTLMLYNDSRLVDIIGVEYSLRLVAFHASADDEVSIQEMSAVLLEIALARSKAGPDLIWRVYDQLQDQNPDMQKMGFDLVRRYVRLAPEDIAASLPKYFANKMTPDVGKTLKVTYIVRQVLGGRDFKEFAEDLHLTTILLLDIATVYHESKDPPPAHRLRTGLNSMSGGLIDEERDRIGDALDNIAQAIMVMGKQQDRGKKTEAFEAALLENKAVPKTAVDFLIFLGGIFARKQKRVVDTYREDMTHPFGERSATMVLEEVPKISKFLYDLLRAFPPTNAPDIELKALNGELDNLWQNLSLYHQRQVHPSLSNSSQYLGQLIPSMANKVNDRQMRSRKIYEGEQLPQNELEVLRWLSGYFNRQHTQ